ncbi:DUF2145 domain-containing protein [Massilia sp. Se16.2.3]|uniref:DUF2145 domain-containing protein n=1 Tax=Massilia sp. Se16.2.3 TaxID=2709303 RepID=UPI001E577D94|nr:DUF2145 domain-containing protein [Massilia sp. Se16.2.3]
MLRFAGVVRRELERSGGQAALVSRAGLDLSRFGLLYSHAAIALKDNPASPPGRAPAVLRLRRIAPAPVRPGHRRLRARGGSAGARPHVAGLPARCGGGASVAAAALDKPLALSLLAGQYSANAHAFSTRYQNCNQWVAELLASAWGGLAGGLDARSRAQEWLRERRYQAGPVKVPSHAMMFAGQFVPLVHVNDHPIDDIHALALQVSVPASIEAFVRQQAPNAQRVELCHDKERIVVHRGWEPLGAECKPGPGDEVIAFGS